MFLRRLRHSLDMIKFEHSVFALPFALTGAALAFRESGTSAAQDWRLVAWIVVAMVSARSAAMAFNRVIDADIDSRNPRTKMRHLPAGLLSVTFAWVFIVASVLLFFVAAWQLNPLCLELAPVALAIVFLYSFTKRFTSLSHLVLGLSLGIAPAAAWIAVRGRLDWRILLLTVAVMFWTAGFDIIYACQDFEFDRREGLFSLPARIGLRNALMVARILHVAMIGALVALAWVLHLGPLSLVGITAVAVLLTYEHSLVRPDDFSRVNAAFFTMNGWVSVLFFLFWGADILFHHSGH
jgi:4-hydroxybenzoate polyprenyltransferase